MFGPAMFDFLIPISFFVLVGFVFFIVLSAWQRNRHLRLVVDFNTRMLDRLGSAKDFAEFQQTEAGAAFMRSFATEAPVTSPQQRILRAAQIGVVLLSLGVGMMLVGWLHRGLDTEAQSGLLVIGSVMTSLGVGYVASCAVSYRLAAMLGVLGKTNSQEHHELT